MAVKSLPVRATPESIHRLNDEIRVMRACCKPHRNIVAFAGQCMLTFPTLLILEYSSIGTLCNYFKRVCIAHSP